MRIGAVSQFGGKGQDTESDELSDATSGNRDMRAVLELILRATACQSADEALEELARHLATTLGVRCARLASVLPAPSPVESMISVIVPPGVISNTLSEK